MILSSFNMSHHHVMASIGACTCVVPDSAREDFNHFSPDWAMRRSAVSISVHVEIATEETLAKTKAAQMHPKQERSQDKPSPLR